MRKILTVAIGWWVTVASAQNFAVTLCGTNVAGMPINWPIIVSPIGLGTNTTYPAILMSGSQLTACQSTNQTAFNSWFGNWYATNAVAVSNAQYAAYQVGVSNWTAWQGFFSLFPVGLLDASNRWYGLQQSQAQLAGLGSSPTTTQLLPVISNAVYQCGMSFDWLSNVVACLQALGPAATPAQHP